MKFHDGSDFTAEDAAFVERARSPSDYRNYISSISGRVVDAFASTSKPRRLIRSCSAAHEHRDDVQGLGEEHGVEQAQNYAEGEENYAVRNAMGTGAFANPRAGRAHRAGAQ